MKIVEPPPVQPTPATSRGQVVQPAEFTGGSGDDASTNGREEQTPDRDTAAVHGVATEEFTPSVQEAMANLIGEVASLREALDRGNKRLDYLTKLADQDSITTLLNRRAFVRELSRVLVLAERNRIGGAMIFLEIENLKEINIRHGLTAGDAVIEHVAGILQGGVIDGTVAGRLGGAEFGLVLLGEPADSARLQAAGLAEAVTARPLIWEGWEIRLAMQWGVHSLLSGEDANAAMNAADRAMRAPGD